MAHPLTPRVRAARRSALRGVARAFPSNALAVGMSPTRDQVSMTTAVMTDSSGPHTTPASSSLRLEQTQG